MTKAFYIQHDNYLGLDAAGIWEIDLLGFFENPTHKHKEKTRARIQKLNLIWHKNERYKPSINPKDPKIVHVPASQICTTQKQLEEKFSQIKNNYIQKLNDYITLDKSNIACYEKIIQKIKTQMSETLTKLEELPKIECPILDFS